MSNDTWLSVIIGAAFSIPVGILASILATVVQRKIDERAKNRPIEQMNRSRAYYNKILNFKNNPSTLTNYMLSVMLQIVTLLGAVGASTGMLVVLTQNNLVGDWSTDKYLFISRNSLIGILLLLNITVSIMIFNLAKKTTSVLSRLNVFEAYRAKMKTIFPDID